ncbi:MAG: CBS domain-containing protein [Phycisphaerae bacterium]
MSTAQAVLDSKGTEVQTIDKSATVLDAARLMNDKRIGALIVSEGKKVMGIFTERDLLMRVVAKKLDPAQTPVHQVMTTPMACCTRKTKLTECKAVMTQKKIRHLPVVEGGKLFGMISSGDLLAHEAADKDTTIEYLSEYLYGRN